MNELQWREAAEAARKGDKAAFEKLYRATERQVYFTCLKLLANEQDAKDAMQDSFVTALQKLDTLQDGARFLQWINRIAVNRCKQSFRKTAEDSLDEQIEQGEEFKDDESFIPEEYVTDAAKRRVIMDIIDNVLSDVQRRTVIMYYYDEMSLEEIAEVMECPVKTVSSRLCSAREKIKEAVLIYEKANNDRLHMFVPVPILTRILIEDAKGVSVPDISPILLGSEFFNAAASAYASTSTTVVAGGSKMVGGILTGKVVAAIAAGVIAVGGVTTAVVMNSSSDSGSSASTTSSVVVTDTSSKAGNDSSSKADSLIISDSSSSKADSSKKDDSSKAVSSENYVEWSIEDLSAFFDGNVKGKPIAQAQQAISEKFDPDDSSWEKKSSGKYSSYHHKLKTNVKIYESVFTEIWIEETDNSGIVNPKNGYVGFYSYFKEKGQAETAEARLNKALKDDGFKGDMTVFFNRWLTNSGMVSCGVNPYKTYGGKLALKFWTKLENAQ